MTGFDKTLLRGTELHLEIWQFEVLIALYIASGVTRPWPRPACQQICYIAVAWILQIAITSVTSHVMKSYLIRRLHSHMPGRGRSRVLAHVIISELLVCH